MKKWVFSYNNALAYEKFSSVEDSNNLVFKYLIKHFDFKDKKVLEIGCGTGRYTKYLAPLAHQYFALEPSTNMLKITKKKCSKFKNIKFINCGGESIPLKTGNFDIIFASWALSSMNSKKIQKKAFNEMKRLLKNNGVIVLVENQHKSEFVDLLGISTNFKKSPSSYFINRFNFKLVKKINTFFKFKSVSNAKKVFAQAFPWLDTKAFFTNKNNGKVKHGVLILAYYKKILR